MSSSLLSLLFRILWRPLILSLLVSPFLLPACSNYSWNQKVTIEVETPSGIRRASSVMHVKWEAGAPWIHGDAGSSRTRLTGETVAIEVAPSRYLFVLFRGMGPAIFHKLRERYESPYSMKEARNDILNLQDPVVLTVADNIRLATFGDMTKPETVRKVNPGDLITPFGYGYRFVSLSISVTDEPVTDGKIAKLLPWLGSDNEATLTPLTGQTTNTRFSSQTIHGDFKRK